MPSFKENTGFKMSGPSPFLGLWDEVKKKVASKVGVKVATKVAKKAGSKVGSRFIPFVGQGLLAKDAFKGMMKSKAKGYSKLKKGTGKRLEAGAYGMQRGTKGGKMVRGTFFGSMK